MYVFLSILALLSSSPALPQNGLMTTAEYDLHLTPLDSRNQLFDPWLVQLLIQWMSNSYSHFHQQVLEAHSFVYFTVLYITKYNLSTSNMKIKSDFI